MIISQISQKLKIPRHYIDYWKKIGLINDERLLSYEDILKIKFIHFSRQKGATLQAIRSYISQISGEKGGWHQNLYLNPVGALLQVTSQDPHPVDPNTQQFYFKYNSKEDNPFVTVDLNSKREVEDSIDNENNFITDEAYLDAIKNGDLHACVKSIKKFLVTEPNDQAAYIELGNTYYELDKYEESKGAYDKAVAIQPDCVEALYNLANIYLREKKHAVSIRYYRQCIHIDPEFPETYYNLGLLLLSLGYKDQAIECMEDYCRLDPDSHWGEQAAQLLEDLHQKKLFESKDNIKNELFLFPTRN